MIHTALRDLAARPDDFAAWDAAGQAYAESGDHEEACAAFAEALHLAPAALAIAARLAGAAIAAGLSEHELARWPGSTNGGSAATASTLLLRAMLLGDLGRHAEALSAAEHLALMAPQSAEAALALALSRTESTPDDAAEQAMRRALTLNPDHMPLHRRFGLLLLKRGQPGEALRLLRRAAERPDADCHNFADLALSALQMGGQEEALQAIRRAVELAPAHAPFQQLLCTIMAYHDGVSATQLTSALRQAGALWPRDGRLRAATRDGTKLRIGVLGGAFWRHPTTLLTVRGVEHLDRDAFELHCFVPNGPVDAYTSRWRTVAAGWHPIGGLHDADIAARIRGAAIDILIDLGGALDIGHLPVMALQPAPVQVKWVGAQFHTTGLAEIDWIITDRFEVPPELAHLYTEIPLELPGSYVCYTPPETLPPVTPLPALQAGFATFGSFNSLMKITPSCLDAWVAILRGLPGSRIFLKAADFDQPGAAAEIVTRLQARGVDRRRIEVAGRSAHSEFLAAYGRVDLALQTFPYGGGVTVLEGLAMGVPSITLAGESFAARHGLSHMSHMDLSQFVVDSPADYVTRALAIAKDHTALAALRAGLRERLLTSPLCDGPGFGQALGAALQRAWAARKPA